MRMLDYVILSLGLLGAPVGCARQPTSTPSSPMKVTTSPKKAPAKTPVGIAVADTASLIEARCAGCHDGDEGRPQLWPAVKTDRDLALRAALMVGAERMPPSKVPEDVRSALIEGLCQVGARDPRTCQEALNPPRAPIVRSSGEYLRLVEQIVVGKSATDADLTRALSGVFNPTTASARADVNLELTTVLLAAERCQIAVPREEFDACVRSLLEFRLWAPQTDEHSTKDGRTP